ncbi:hypothetical protein HOLleu_32790 [Holothuria leucospilota]|uniref:SRCR domain-containing protein n=1 Tax=Holothuria leucospilota TaxID=206669 RepID=A0A9Q1GXM4_HOLLE|nr:hypothetical protein HOLleu_32790 [Holothuria leucospilota]
MVVDQVNCSGEETTLLQCKHKNDSNCKYDEDVFVVCIAEEDFDDEKKEKMEKERPVDPMEQDQKGSSSVLIIFVVLFGILVCILAVTSVYRHWTIRCIQKRNPITSKVERPLPTPQQELKYDIKEQEEGQYQIIEENLEVTPYNREIHNSEKETSTKTSI